MTEIRKLLLKSEPLYCTSHLNCTAAWTNVYLWQPAIMVARTEMSSSGRTSSTDQQQLMPWSTHRGVRCSTPTYWRETNTSKAVTWRNRIRFCSDLTWPAATDQQRLQTPGAARWNRAARRNHARENNNKDQSSPVRFSVAPPHAPQHVSMYMWILIEHKTMWFHFSDADDSGNADWTVVKLPHQSRLMAGLYAGINLLSRFLEFPLHRSQCFHSIILEQSSP